MTFMHVKLRIVVAILKLVLAEMNLKIYGVNFFGALLLGIIQLTDK